MGGVVSPDKVGRSPRSFLNFLEPDGVNGLYKGVDQPYSEPGAAMTARNPASSNRLAYLLLAGLAMLSGCFGGNQYDYVRWSSPEASYPLVRNDDYLRSDGEPARWRIVSIDTNQRTHWLVVELADAGDPTEHNLHLGLSLLSANFSRGFLSDTNKRQPPLKLFSEDPHWVVGAAVDYDVLAGYGLRSWPEYRASDSDGHRFCAPLQHSAAIDRVIRSMERGDRVVLRIQGGAESFFGESYEYTREQ